MDGPLGVRSPAVERVLGARLASLLATRVIAYRRDAYRGAERLHERARALVAELVGDAADRAAPCLPLQGAVHARACTIHGMNTRFLAGTGEAGFARGFRARCPSRRMCANPQGSKTTWQRSIRDSLGAVERVLVE